LAALAWAAIQYGPPGVVQPVARFVLERIDRQFSNRAHRSADGTLPPNAATEFPLRAPSALGSLDHKVVADPPYLLEVQPGGSEPLDEDKPKPRQEPAVGDLAIADQASPPEALQRRLVELGAAECTVEPWGSGGLYRTSCRVSLHENSLIQRHFEATANAPEDAIHEMARQIEQWRRRAVDGQEQDLAISR
jgi:hypothetical protein